MPIRETIVKSLLSIIDDLHFVKINKEHIPQLSSRIAKLSHSDWRNDLIFFDDSWRSANLLAMFSIISFCYWPGEWHLKHNGKKLGGSYSLFLSMKKAVQRGEELFNASTMATLTLERFKSITKGEGGIDIPLAKERCRLINLFGNVLIKSFGGTITNLLQSENNNANSIHEKLLSSFPFIRDEFIVNGQTLKFYKKSQEIISLIYEQFQGRGIGEISQMHDLSVSSDYKLPQILNGFGVLQYQSDTEKIISGKQKIDTGSLLALEIRAATVAIGEMISEECGIPPFQISNKLWTLSQTSIPDVLPFPRIYGEWV